MSDSRELELTASEQMRDRIADWLAEEAAKRAGGGSSALKLQKHLLFVEARVRCFPGRLAQPETVNLIDERTRRNER
ncbi:MULTISPECIES: hypothetical protein [unclassified Novosphingobium]|uniref:hypothetical protein n=1 Tax=unclassified Novosphingobium TaxID=2644732 RepID=UPI001357193C|nr:MULTISPECIES: hypothetical protein [unclassified Novosphingobium]